MTEPLRILVVDDNPADAHLLCRQFEGLADWRVVSETCSSVGDVRSGIREFKPDIVFVDYLLGAENGITLTRRLRAGGVDCAFVVLTGQGNEQVAAEAMRAGALDYLTKDELSREALDRTVRYVTGRRQAERDLTFAYRELETRVRERTAELERANGLLSAEIRERERAEEKLRKLSRAVEQSPNMVVITNADGIIEYVNPRFAEMTGFGAAEAVGRRPALLGPSDRHQAADSGLETALRTGNEWKGEVQDRRKDGRLFWVSASLSPIRNSQGAITHFVLMEEDITERKFAEMRLREAKEQAEVANRAKSELLANMSHELRTPLNAIIGFSSTIQAAVFGPLGNRKYAEYVEDIHASGQHLLELINDILDVSAIEAGRLELHEEPLDLARLIEASMRLVRSRAEKGAVTLNRELPATVPHLLADERRVKQILLNLLSNAIKFTPEGGRVTLRVSREEGNPAAGGLVLTVEDTGIGMTDPDIAKALSPFGQVDSSLGRKYEGTGLGLPLTVRLVELHGGDLMIHSAPDEGTTVTVRFPAWRLLSPAASGIEGKE